VKLNKSCQVEKKLSSQENIVMSSYHVIMFSSVMVSAVHNIGEATGSVLYSGSQISYQKVIDAVG
jgi:hypothetical protein